LGEFEIKISLGGKKGKNIFKSWIKNKINLQRFL
jgi:hypothetical protein